MNCLTVSRHSDSRRRGFSLVEVLLAILILGIGIISIAALFPAGIAQQRLANDDVMGPIVANHAISIIRSRVRQEDFGTFEEFQGNFMDGWKDPGTVPQAYFSRTLPGDWDWMRPGFLLEDDDDTDRFDESGAIDIFSNRFTLQAWNAWTGPTTDLAVATEFPEGWPDEDVWNFMGGSANNHPLHGIPYNTGLYGYWPPDFIISQRERYYPMQTELANNEGKPRPQYVWDCMFRRHQGRVYVAIFVYRVSANDTSVPFIVPPNADNEDLPPIPYRLSFAPDAETPYNSGARSIRYQNGRAVPFVLGSENANDFFDDPDLPHLAWQRSRQWLLDQNNNIHRVVNVERDPDDASVLLVELVRPLQPVMLGWWSNDTTEELGSGPNWDAIFNSVGLPTDAPNYYFADPASETTANVDWPFTDAGVLTDLWYIPRHVEVDDVEFTLTPVFVTVKEL